MRILLDAHISGNGVARPLRANGHDVVAVDERPELSGANDESLLRLARDQRRVMVTFDVGDFSRLVVRFVATEGGHAGCILLSSKTFAPNEFGAISRSILALLAQYPDASDWRNRVEWLGRA